MRVMQIVTARGVTLSTAIGANAQGIDWVYAYHTGPGAEHSPSRRADRLGAPIP
jgi:hypothetical protein